MNNLKSDNRQQHVIYSMKKADIALIAACLVTALLLGMFFIVHRKTGNTISISCDGIELYRIDLEAFGSGGKTHYYLIQYEDLSEDANEDINENLSEDSNEDSNENLSEDSNEDLSENLSEDSNKDLSEDLGKNLNTDAGQDIHIMHFEEYPELPTGRSYNLFSVTDGVVTMEAADCRDQICVRHKPISADRESIICLPNRLVLEMSGNAVSERQDAEEQDRNDTPVEGTDEPLDGVVG